MWYFVLAGIGLGHLWELFLASCAHALINTLLKNSRGRTQKKIKISKHWMQSLCTQKENNQYLSFFRNGYFFIRNRGHKSVGGK
jgi:hypothetical protein